MRSTLIFPSKVQAENFLDKLKRILDKFGHVSIADVKNCIGFTLTDVDSKFGWKDISKIVIDTNSFSVENDTKCTITFPKAEPIS